MNLYVLDQFFTLSPDRERNIKIYDEYGGIFLLENKILKTSRYVKYRVIGQYDLKGLHISVEINSEKLINPGVLAELKREVVCLNLNSGDSINMAPVELAALIDRKHDTDEVTFFKVECEGNWEIQDLVVYDWHSGKFKKVQLDKDYKFMTLNQYGRICYGDALHRGELIKYDADLNPTWIYKTSYKKGWQLKYEGILSTDQYVVFSEDSGKSREGERPNPTLDDDSDRHLSQLYARPLLLDGRVVCLEDETGAVAWKRDFEYQIDSRVLLDSQRLAVLTANWIYILDVHDGSVKQVLETGLDRITRSGFLFADDRFLYFFSNDFNQIHIYEKPDLNLVRVYEGEKGHTPFRAGPQIINGLVAVRLHHGLASSELLVIDPNDIQAPMEAEELDHMWISVPEKEVGPIVLDVEDEDLCKVLRHVEHHSVELADFHGQEGRGLEFNKHFSGEIILRYKTSDRGELIHKYLERLTERVGSKIREWGICSGSTGKELCSLRYELVD